MLCCFVPCFAVIIITAVVIALLRYPFSSKDRAKVKDNECDDLIDDGSLEYVGEVRDAEFRQLG